MLDRNIKIGKRNPVLTYFFKFDLTKTRLFKYFILFMVAT